MLDVSNHRDDRLDTILPSMSAPGIRRWTENRQATMRARRHATLAERVRRESPVLARGQSVACGLLAAWDAAQADARARFAAQTEAYRLARLVPDQGSIESQSPVWRATLNDLHDLNTLIEA